MRTRSQVLCAASAALALVLLLFPLGACKRSTDGEAPPAEAGEAGGAVVEVHPEMLAAQEAAAAGDLQETRRHLEAVPPEDPSYLIALGNLTTIYTTLGELELALDAYRKLAELKGDDPQVFLGMAWTQYRLGRYGEAEVSALRAIELDGEDAASRYNVAFFRLAQGRLPEAVRAYHAAMKLDFDMAYVGSAEGHLLRLLEERPDFAEVHYILAYIANAKGNRREETDELERYLDLAPQGPVADVARARLAEARAALGDAP